MSEQPGTQLKCQRCGHVHPTVVERCSACGAAMGEVDGSLVTGDDWSDLSRSLKTRWVAVVMAFWVSVVVLAAVFFLEGRLSIVLMSICLGLLVLGVWLKTRYQLHLRKGPSGH